MVLPFDLQDFIVRGRVLKLYRKALRTANRAPPHARGEEIFDLFIFPTSQFAPHFAQSTLCFIQ